MKSGLSRQYIAMLENEKKIPRLDSLFQIAHGLDMSVLQFIEELQRVMKEEREADEIMQAADSKSVKWVYKLDN